MELFQFNDVIQSLRLTQPEVAAIMGSKLDRVKGLCSGRIQKLKQEEIDRLTEALKLNPKWVQNGEGDMFLPSAPDAVSHHIAFTKKQFAKLTEDIISEEHRPYLVDILWLADINDKEGLKRSLKAFGEYVDKNYTQNISVPHYDIQASAGSGCNVWNERPKAHVPFSSEWIKKQGLVADKLSLIDVYGDSMEPLLQHGDMVMIDHRINQLMGDHIYVLQNDGHLFVKRVQPKLDGSVLIKSENPVYEPETLSGAALERLSVVGRVVWYGRSV